MAHRFVALGWIAGAAAGCGSIHSEKEAPFALHPKRILWSLAQGDDDAYGEAFLIFANDKLECSAFDGTTEEVLQRVLASGDGLGFQLRASADEGSVVPEYVGLWSYDTIAYEEPYASSRYLDPFAFANGFLTGVYGNSSPWLLLDQADADGVKGEFRAAWWWGTFRAEVCPSYELEDTGTTPSTPTPSTP